MDKFEIEKKLEEISDRFVPENISESDKKEILSELDAILNSDPQNTDAYFLKGLLYQCKEDYRNAIEMYEEILKIKPDDQTAKDSIKDCTEFLQWDLDRKEHNKEYSKSSENNAPDLLEKVSIWHILILKAIVIAIMIYVCFMPLIQTNHDKKILNKISETPKQETTYRVLNDENQTFQDDFEDLRINPTSDYDYMSKKEIYDIRKRYVQDSIFADPNYEPSDAVFGQIVDGKPWWGDIKCGMKNYHGDYHEHIEGDSKVSVQMNNPNALVGISLPYMPWKDPYYGEYCTAEYSKFSPVSLKYNKKENLLVATYNILPEFLEFGVLIGNDNRFLPLELSGLNARDFGYNYVWAVDTKNIKMFNSGNVAEEVQTFQDFIHLGGSCQYQDGCNNISPTQNGLMFNIKGLPAEINLKLWKKQPSDKFSKPDMYYKIIFEEL